MGLIVEFNIVGASDVANNLLKLASIAGEAVAQSLNEVAEVTLTDAKERTPVDTGTLKSSGKVSEHATLRKHQAKLTYGTEYAVWVHEQTNLKHRVGEAKFLEKALQKTAATFVQTMVDKVRSRIGT